MRNFAAPAIGVLAAVAITWWMDANGYLAFGALPLCPLLAAFWYFDRLSRREAGFTLGRAADHGVALLYPLVVMGTITAAAFAAGAIDLGPIDWGRTIRNLVLVTLSTILVATVTEEGFFRGWLWGSLARRGLTPGAILIASSLAFMLWHVAAVVLPTGFDVPARQVPIFLANATLLGANWGLLRWLSGSVVVASVSHGLWNGFAYVLFGFGTRVGALGIEDTALFGPEVGLLGLALNSLYFAAFWWLTRRRRAKAADPGI